MYTRALTSGLAELLRARNVVGLVACRAFDCTPWRVQFGQLSERVQDHAKYPVKDSDGVWKMVSLKTLREMKGQSIRQPSRGSVELLGQRLSLAWVDTDGLQHRCEVPVCPQFLQDGRSSTMYRAIDSSQPALSYATLP